MVICNYCNCDIYGNNILNVFNTINNTMCYYHYNCFKKMTGWEPTRVYCNVCEHSWIPLKQHPQKTFYPPSVCPKCKTTLHIIDEINKHTIILGSLTKIKVGDKVVIVRKNHHPCYDEIDECKRTNDNTQKLNELYNDINELKKCKSKSKCNILKKHNEILKDDPDKLSTNFIKNLLKDNIN